MVKFTIGDRQYLSSFFVCTLSLKQVICFDQLAWAVKGWRNEVNLSKSLWVNVCRFLQPDNFFWSAFYHLIIRGSQLWKEERKVENLKRCHLCWRCWKCQHEGRRLEWEEWGREGGREVSKCENFSHICQRGGDGIKMMGESLHI